MVEQMCPAHPYNLPHMIGTSGKKADHDGGLPAIPKNGPGTLHEAEERTSRITGR